MADSIRQQILDAVDTRLKTIKTTAGYKTNIGNNVFDWLDRDLDDTELDALIYRDKINELSSSTITQWINKVQLEIEVKTKSGATTAKQVRMMVADIYKAIGVDATWGGLALRSNPVSEEMDLQHQDKIIGSAKIVINIEYVKSKWSY